MAHDPITSKGLPLNSITAESTCYHAWGGAVLSTAELSPGLGFFFLTTFSCHDGAYQSSLGKLSWPDILRNEPPVFAEGGQGEGWVGVLLCEFSLL